MKIQIPEAFDFLFSDARGKVAEGGRGSAKSESYGRYILSKGMEQTENIVCAREFQSSIRDSVHAMLAYFVSEYKLTREYNVLDTEIQGTNGTTISFVGVRKNINNIKSMHNIKRFWGEEAQTFSKQSLDLIFPTVRAEGSELLFTMNADLEEDPAYQMLVLNPPPNFIVRKVNYDQNPFFPEVLRTEMEYMKEHDYQKYLHIWEGFPKAAVEGAIFSKELHQAQADGRIMKVPYDPMVPVDTFWDLGKSNLTAIWFVQYVGMQYRVLRCYSNHLQEMAHYLKVVKDLPYVYGTHHLPHDAEHERLGMDRSIETQARDVLGNVRIVPRVAHKINAIEAARAIFPLCYFDKDLCSEGLSDLRHYAYAMDPATGKISKEPMHDIHSDVSDAFQCFAMAIDQQNRPQRPTRFQSPSDNYVQSSQQDPWGA